MSKIFVALATYNGERFLAEMLDSLAKQNRPADQIFAVDDASSDSSVSILEQYTSKLPMQISVRKKNGGHRAAFSDAFVEIQKVAGDDDWIAIADQDDIWLPEKLELLEKALQGASESFAFGDAHVIDANGKRIADSWRSLAGICPEIPFRSRLCGTNNANGCLSLFSASLLKTILPIPEWIPVYDEWIALCAAKSGGILAIPDAILDYRIHDQNSVGIKPDIRMSDVLKINRHVAEGLLATAERLNLSSADIIFVERYRKFLKTSLEHSPNFSSIPWLFENRNALFPGCSTVKLLKKIFGSSLGFPFCKHFLGKN
ncbi:MAG: glycosyltransferase [Fibrobacter sp.]|nr:glycosyltransferase [Fibrobacter sp.]